MVQLHKELIELKTLSSYATSLSCYIYLNITGMSKIMKKFDKKFKRYNLHFTKNFVIEKYQKKNSDLLYIHQYKILDEVGACVEQLKNELKERYYYLIRNKIDSQSEEENKSVKIDDDANIEEGLLENQNKDESEGSIEKIKSDFIELNNSIGNMEAFYHNISLVFDVWMRYIKNNEYKSHIYSVKGNSLMEEENLIENEEEGIMVKPKHFLSNESYRNIRIILIQAFIMTLCSTYIYPTILYFLTANDEVHKDYQKLKKGLLCGLVIAMIPLGALISMTYVHFLVKKSYKILIILSREILYFY